MTYESTLGRFKGSITETSYYNNVDSEKQMRRINYLNPFLIYIFLIKLACIFQFLSKLGSADLVGEIGVFFNTPQPFTVRTKKLSQVIRISHHHFKEMVQPQNEDGMIMIKNFIQVRNIIYLICPLIIIRTLLYNLLEIS